VIIKINSSEIYRHRYQGCREIFV